MSTNDPIALDLAFDGGALALDPSGDLAAVSDEQALRQRLLLALLTTPGTIPYFPDDGADAEAAEGGPALDGAALVRRVRAQAARDPDVLRVGEVTARRDADGVTVLSLRATTRRAPNTETLITLRTR